MTTDAMLEELNKWCLAERDYAVLDHDPTDEDIDDVYHSYFD